METIKIEMSERAAMCFQRMIADEIENQEEWKREDAEASIRVLGACRDGIIKEMNELADGIEKQGVGRYYK